LLTKGLVKYSLVLNGLRQHFLMPAPPLYLDPHIHYKCALYCAVQGCQIFLGAIYQSGE
jgi:hypothetical protein